MDNSGTSRRPNPFDALLGRFKRAPWGSFELADIYCNKILDSTLDLVRWPEFHRICNYNSIGQWQRSGALSDKEDGLKGTAVGDLRRLAESAKCTLPHDKVFGLLGLFPRAISSKIRIDYKRDETELSAEFTTAISIANEKCAGDVKVQSTTVNSIYALQDVPGRERSRCNGEDLQGHANSFRRGRRYS